MSTVVTDPTILASLKELESILEKPKYGSFKCAQCKAKEGCKRNQKCNACKSACNVPILFGGKRKTRRGHKGRKTRKQTRRRR